MSVEDVLRDTLRSAPEPPDDLAQPPAVRRRATALKRRRYAAVASAVTCVALVLVGIAVIAPSRRGADVTPAGPAPAGRYPDWPRRGDAPRSLDAQAVRAYERSLPPGVAQARPARVLYAAGGDRPVVVLHTVQTKRGERLVVVTGEPREPLRVYSNTAAPAPGTQVVSIVLRHPDDRANPCLEEMFRRPYDARLLLITAVDRLQWSARAPLGCDGRHSAQTATESFPLTGGAGLVDTGVTGHAEYLLHGDQLRDAYYLRGPGDVLNPRGDERPVDAGRDPLGWAYRNDGSRAADLRETLFRAPELAAYGGDCVTSWYASLPDGTPVAFCVTGGGDRVPRRAVIAAEGADRKLRVYVEQKADPVPAAFAAVVDGFDGRWLVAVGPETLTGLTLVDGARRTDIPVEEGAGWLRLEEEPSPDAYLTTADFAPGGGFGIQDREGRVLTVRR